MAQTFSKIIKLSIIFILILACSDTQEEVEVNAKAIKAINIFFIYFPFNH